MGYRLIADLILLLHLAFAIFAVAGGLLVLWKPLVAWIHVPAAIWAAFIELSGKVCPLTPMENHFRLRAGQSGYEGDFLQRYLIDLLYPDALTREVQLTLGALVLIINLGIYGWWYFRRAAR